MLAMVADFLQDLDDAGFGDQCQTQEARFLAAAIYLNYFLSP
jgi:hypothetical protein